VALFFRRPDFMTLVEKLSDVRDFRKILETTVKEIGENYSADVCQIVLSNPLDGNFTSICEYVSNPEEVPEDLSSTTFPVQPEGGALGWLSVSRQMSLSSQEVDEIRIILANIADLLRYAQINDIVQRDTFRSAFMSEIINLMSLKMGLGDALFMVVNILGKALAVSRCVFICVDDSSQASTSEWKSYEYWQRERIEAAQEYGWPTKDSAVVAQTLLATVPIIVFEGQHNSFKTPVQEEMEFIGVRSQLSVALRSSIGVHGCIIVQQCESRHAWTRDEIDMVQNVADTVAEALAQLDEEKKTAEPIMRLYQRDVAETKEEGQKSIQEVRKALKSALGTTTIKKAQKSRGPESDSPPPPPAVARPLDFAPQVDAGGGAGEPADASTPLAQFSPSEIWTQAEMGTDAPAEPNYEEAYARAGYESELSYEVEATYTGEPNYEVEPGWGTAPGFETAGQEVEPGWGPPPGYEMGGFETAAQAEPGWETPPGYEMGDYAGAGQETEPGYGGEPSYETAAPEEAGLSYEVEPGYAGAEYEAAAGAEMEYAQESEPSYEVEPTADAGAQTSEPQLADLANLIEEQATQSEPPADKPYKGYLNSLLGNRRTGPRPGAWDIETSQDQPPPPSAPAGAGVFPAAPVTPAARTGPPTPAGPPAPGKLTANKLTARPLEATPPVPLPPVPHPPTPPQVPPVARPPLARTAPIQAETPAAPQHEAAPPAATPHPPRAPSKWGDLDSIQSPSVTTRPISDDWAQLNSIPTPTTGGKTGLGAMMMGKAKASAISGGSGLGQSLHKGGVKPPAPPPSFIEGPPIQMNEAEEAAAEARLKQILASSNPTSDYIFATPGVDMRLLGRIDGWISQIEPKDKYVSGHVHAVAEYATAVSRMLGLSADDQNTIRLAAIIHDVGKLGLPKMILQKPDEELSDTELVMSMNHTIDGAKLVEEFQELAFLAPIVLGHHEEYDGNGYPEGLAGDDIPLAARIIHVCNVYAELVSDLVYRAGIEPEQAQNTLIMGAGATYDPDIVQALIAAISQGLVPDRFN
jgi:HD-GYP domain-containing protein (c-di-GMP phosphodiesterase class II)